MAGNLDYVSGSMGKGIEVVWSIASSWKRYDLLGGQQNHPPAVLKYRSSLSTALSGKTTMSGKTA